MSAEETRLDEYVWQETPEYVRRAYLEWYIHRPSTPAVPHNAIPTARLLAEFFEEWSAVDAQRLSQVFVRALWQCFTTIAQHYLVD